MQITWLGHGSFRIEIGGQVLLVDPWLEGNPVFPDERRADAIKGATHILLTHAHDDHASEVPGIAKELGIPVVCIVEAAARMTTKDDFDVLPMNRGGTQHLGNVAVTMVNAVHSSSFDHDSSAVYGGGESGFMIAGEGHTIYFSGDTDIMADMEWMGEFHKPDIGILSAGGHFTMDMERAAWAAKRYFDFRHVIPGHWGTFDLLEQSADAMVSALPGVDVRVPVVMEPMSFEAGA